jgi:hypothetical protein
MQAVQGNKRNRVASISSQITNMEPESQNTVTITQETQAKLAYLKKLLRTHSKKNALGSVKYYNSTASMFSTTAKQNIIYIVTNIKSHENKHLEQHCYLGFKTFLFSFFKPYHMVISNLNCFHCAD